MDERKQINLATLRDGIQKFKETSEISFNATLAEISDPRLKMLDWQKMQDELQSMEAMIDSMTTSERENPELIDASRCKRIAGGSGKDVQDLKKMVNEFLEMREVMKG